MGLAKYLMSQRRSAYQKNLQNILKLALRNKKAKILDLGCDNGVWTMRVAKKIGTLDVFGVDLAAKRVLLAKNNGVKVLCRDIGKKLPYENNVFDVIHANQVIEHIANSDLFISEIYRLLKKGGYAIISTENLSSWHNIFALVLGYMPFSLTNTSCKTGALGNPLDAHSNEEFCWLSDAWQHQRVFTTIGWKHLFELYEFTVEKMLASGYYPFGNLFSGIDPYHSAFITFRIRK